VKHSSCRTYNNQHNHLHQQSSKLSDSVAEMSARQCLLIFDNAEDITLQSSGLSTIDTGRIKATEQIHTRLVNLQAW
jgi:hypothetical protein